MKKEIKLSSVEIQSNTSRVKLAEGLIRQLPIEHEGRNSWLLSYGTCEESNFLRKEKGLEWIEETECCEVIDPYIGKWVKIIHGGNGAAFSDDMIGKVVPKPNERPENYGGNIWGQLKNKPLVKTISIDGGYQYAGLCKGYSLKVLSKGEVLDYFKEEAAKIGYKVGDKVRVEGFKYEIRVLDYMFHSHYVLQEVEESLSVSIDEGRIVGRISLWNDRDGWAEIIEEKKYEEGWYKVWKDGRKFVVVYTNGFFYATGSDKKYKDSDFDKIESRLDI